MNQESTIYKLNLIAVLEDIQDQLLVELQPELRHTMKALTNNARVQTRRLIQEFDRIHTPENANGFGETADGLRAIIDNYLHENK